jgi:hypothetical protein
LATIYRVSFPVNFQLNKNFQLKEKDQCLPHDDDNVLLEREITVIPTVDKNNNRLN